MAVLPRIIQSVFALPLLIAMVVPVTAQEARGSIAGKVADPQGAAIAGAHATITNVETNAITRSGSNDTGYFEATLLNPGRYTVAVEAPGFKRSVRSGVELNVAGRLELTFQLEVGAVTESVEVFRRSAVA
jgi:hypothetical protein